MFYFLVSYLDTDIEIHLEQILEINLKNKEYPPNFLYYLTVSFFSGFTTNPSILSLVAIILLSAATAVKYLISKKIIYFLASKDCVPNKQMVVSIAILLMICFSIPDFIFLNRFYLGKFVPNIWHNSTTIFLFPFALWLFWEQLAVLMNPNKLVKKKIILISILMVINTIIKPSFLLPFIPVSLIFIFLYHKKWLLNITPFIIGLIAICVLYFYIYSLQLGNIEEATNTIAISSPFLALSKWIPLWYLPISFIMSFAFPLAVFIIYNKQILKYPPFVFASTLTLFGLFISAFLIEEGPRKFHCNFMWQNVICTYLLFLTTVAFLFPKISNTKSKKLKIIISIFGLHVIGGVVYICKMYITFSYY